MNLQSILNGDHYDLVNEPIVFSKSMFDLCFSHKTLEVDTLLLYQFYYYTAKWQKTDRPKATTGYVASGLSWSINRVRRHKKVLLNMGLISDVTVRGSNGKIISVYVYVNFIWTNQKVKEVVDKEIQTIHLQEVNGQLTFINEKLSQATGITNHPGGCRQTNALSVNNNIVPKGTSFEDEPQTTKKGKLSVKEFDLFWDIFPSTRKGSKQQALKRWETMCKEKKVSYKTIKKAIKAQKKTKKWKNGYAPMAVSWLNIAGWNEDIKEMNNTKGFKKSNNNGVTIGHHENKKFKTKKVKG